MKKRLITWLLAVCMILGMLPVSAIAAAPTAMKITPDKNVFVATQESTGKKENLYICNPAKMVEQTDGSKAGTLTFTVLDQDGKDITRYITWSSDNVGVLRFDDPSEAIATIPEPTKKSSATKVVITATYSKAGGQEFQAAYELTIVPALNLSHADLTDLYPDGIALKEDGSGFECSMKSKLHPTIIYRTYDLYEMTSDKEISVSVGSDWLTIKGKYPGKYTATFTQKNQPDNTVTQIVPVSGVAVETDAKLMGSFTMDTGKTQKLIAYTAHKDDGFVCHSGEDAQVTWTSSDPAVATVDENGVVTAVGLGQAVITAQDDYFSGEQTEGYKGSIKVTVKEAGKPIAESIGISFDGSNNIYTDPAMGSKQKATTSTYKVGDVSMSYSVVYGPFDNNNDKLYLKPQTSLKNLNIAASFDSANVKAEVYHNNTLAGELVYGENFVLFPEAGENDIRVKFAYKDNASAVNEYAFSFYVKPDTNIKAASSPVTLTSPNRDMSKTVKYNNNDEGKAFKAANGVPSSTSGLNNATEWISVVYSDIQKVKVSLKAGHAVYGRIAYRLEENGPIVKESRGTLETDELQFGDKDEIILYVVTTSAEAYLNAKTAGTDPWADATKTTTYKYTIKRSAFSMADMNLTSVSLGNTGTIQSFDPTADSIIGILPSSAANAELTVTAPEGYAVHNPTSATGTANANNQIKPDADGNLTKSFVTTPKDSLKVYTKYLAVQATAEYDKLIRRNYTVILAQAPIGVTATELLPSSVVSYLNVASKHTNDKVTGSYQSEMVDALTPTMLSQGNLPERTLFGWAKNTFSTSQSWMGYDVEHEKTLVSLGNFGGHITYYFADGIQNDPNNPNGVDFVVYGQPHSAVSAFKYEDNPLRNATAYVSVDGETWYELAGSEHYDENALWNYSVTYSQAEDGTANYTDNQGRSGNLGAGYLYPVSGNYPLYQGNMTFGGTLLLGTNKLDSSLNGEAFDAAWGYAGLEATPQAATTDAPNPYAGTENLGNGFDLSWAVNEKGLPVKLDSVKYVKIVSANLLTTDNKCDDKSAVVSAIIKTAPVDNGIAAAEASAVKILVDGKEVSLESGKELYSVTPAARSFTVKVEAPEGANVYINNAAGTERSYNGDFDFAKGVVRIIVQSGTASPEIYYLQISDPVATASENAIAELKAYKDPADYREAQKTELANAITAGETAINAATTVEEVTAALTAAKAEIDKIKTDAQLDQEKPTTPSTGDNTTLGLLFGIMFVSLLAVAVLLLTMKKKSIVK